MAHEWKWKAHASPIEVWVVPVQNHVMVLARPSHFAMCLCLSLCSSSRECGATCEEQIVTREITQNALCWSWLRLWISFCAYSAFTECKTEPNLLHTCWSNPCSKKLVELANSCWSKTALDALSFTVWYVLQTEQADDTWAASRVYNPFRLVWGEMWWQIMTNYFTSSGPHRDKVLW